MQSDDVSGDVKRVSEGNRDVTGSGDGCEIVRDIENEGHWVHVRLDFWRDIVVGEKAAVDCGVFERRSSERFEYSDLAFAGREVLCDSSEVKGQRRT